MGELIHSKIFVDEYKRTIIQIYMRGDKKDNWASITIGHPDGEDISDVFSEEIKRCDDHAEYRKEHEESKKDIMFV
jgi:hypothetical protein